MPIEEICPISLEDLNQEQNCNGNASGVKSIMYALKDDIKTWPAKKTPETRTSLSDYVNTLDGNIVMKPGKRFFALHSKKDSGELKYTQEGESGSKSLTAALEIYHPGMSAKLLGFISATQNQEMVMLVKLKNNDWHLIGDADEGVEHESAEATSGKATSDPNGAAIVFSQSGVNAPTIYKGSVDHLKEVADSGSGS